MNFDSDGIKKYDSLVAALERNEYRSKTRKLELDMKHGESPSSKPSSKEALKLELKALPPHLMYVFLGRDYTLPVIIIEEFSRQQVEWFVAELKRFK